MLISTKYEEQYGLGIKTLVKTIGFDKFSKE